jgi:hypothetical protein
MTNAARGPGAVPAQAGRLRSAPAAFLQVDGALVVDVLARLAGADTSAAVAAAGLPPLLDLPGVRAVAVVARDRSRVVVLGSAGYDCGPMSPGGVLPLDAGLPVTEAVRTGRTVQQGQGPAWVAVPFRRERSGRGALLLSLDAAPPQTQEELSSLERLGRAIGDGLDRASAQEQAQAELALLTAGLLVPPAALPGWELAVRSVPYDGPVGGDVVLCLPDERGGSWLVVADACGSGLTAAVLGRTVCATFTALASLASGPADLLAAADRALRTVVQPGGFVTAVAVHVRDGQLSVASAGHPVPLLLTAEGAEPLAVEAGQPLALETGRAGERPVLTRTLPAGSALLLHTDGLTDRRGDDRPLDAQPLHLVRWLSCDDLEAFADAVLAGAELVGGAGDDVSLLVARPV